MSTIHLCYNLLAMTEETARSTRPAFEVLHDLEGDTAHQMRNFLGNLSLSYAGKTAFSRMSPIELARAVRERMVREIALFEKEQAPDGKGRFRLDSQGHLIPKKGVRETHGFTLSDFEILHQAVQESISLEKLHDLIDPLEARRDKLIEEEI